MKINCILDEMVYCCTNYCIFYSTGSADTASGIGSDCDSASAFFVSAADFVAVAAADTGAATGATVSSATALSSLVATGEEESVGVCVCCTLLSSSIFFT